MSVFAREMLNSTIQWIRYTARGFRNREKLRDRDLLPRQEARPLPTLEPEEPVMEGLACLAKAGRQ
jgi:hypothetical protein